MLSKIPHTLILIFGLILISCTQDYSGEDGMEKALKLHHEFLTVDSHTDTPLRFFRAGTNLALRSDSRKGGGKLDFPRMEEGGLDAVFFAVFLGQRERTPEGNETAKIRALALFDSIRAVVERSSDMAEIALSSSDLETIDNKGKRAVYIGIENGFPIGRDLSLVERFYKLGARYITLCHTANNDICDSSTDEDGEEHGAGGKRDEHAGGF